MTNGFKFDMPKNAYFKIIRSSVVLLLSGHLAQRYEAQYDKAQRFLTNEVMKGCAPYTPKQSGNLIRTVKDLWNAVLWPARYAAPQYYKYGDTRSYDPLRGGHWFERWKVDSGKQAVDTARRIAGGGKR